MEAKKQIEYPQAFPIDETQFEFGQQILSAKPGMTLRDYFAAKAMNGMLANSIDKNQGVTPPWTLSPDQIAKDAYWFADAMLKARSATE